MLMSTMTMVLVCTITLHHYMREEITIAASFSSILVFIITTVLVPMEMSTMSLVHMREGLVITTLAYMEMLANTLEKDTITLVLMGMPTVMVLYSRMDPTIATVWMKKLRQRGLIWPVLQSPNPKHHIVVSMEIL